MEIRIVGYGHPDAQLLMAEVQQEYVRRYGDGDATVLDEAEFERPNGIFAVAYDAAGTPLGTAAWRAQEGGEIGLADGDAEIKRMYTRAQARGRGVARRMLRFLEEDARRAGRRRMVLETGDQQPEALALYEAEGYLPIVKFGYYREYESAICLGKDLRPSEPAPARGDADADAAEYAARPA
ncbi:GNAT superfamily N-acetyltransferase [Streptacidiphilus sp. MAP12-20]|uniref:GNAT family N-acetyltransferase n=1 Tax=Streptacidiphilus sp. MAP12-20 TaxID=3156299 RepID=UPI0035174787